jgi:hypothetical protein
MNQLIGIVLVTYLPVKGLFVCFCLQIEDYANRKDKDVGYIEKWLSPVLAYDS